MSDVSLTQQNNLTTWELLGRSTNPSQLFEYGDRHRDKPFPGMLVTSYKGQQHALKTRLVGIGIIVGVVPYEVPIGNQKFECYVLWNFLESDYNFPP